MASVLAACGSSTPPAVTIHGTGTAAAPAKSQSASPGKSTGYPDQAADEALCGTYNTDIKNGDAASIEAALQQAGGSVSPGLATDMQAVVNGSSLSQDLENQVNVAMDCALVAVGKSPPAQGFSGVVASSQPSSAPAAPSSPSAAPAPTMTRQVDTVVFKVSGSGYPSVQYGSDSNNNDAPGGYGPLGNGVALPWSESLMYDPSALYYAVSAQLQGYGDISDSVTEVITTYCSDGSSKTESFPLASGQASGGYAIAQAEYTGGDTGNAAQAESDAGR